MVALWLNSMHFFTINFHFAALIWVINQKRKESIHLLTPHSNLFMGRCTNPSFFGCERTGSIPMIINPIRSSKIRTSDSFSFKYGKVEISAKMPTGDWLLPGAYTSQDWIVRHSNENIIIHFFSFL